MFRQNLTQILKQKLTPNQAQLLILLQKPTLILDEQIQKKIKLNSVFNEIAESYDIFDLIDNDTDNCKVTTASEMNKKLNQPGEELSVYSIDVTHC